MLVCHFWEYLLLDQHDNNAIMAHGTTPHGSGADLPTDIITISEAQHLLMVKPQIINIFDLC